MFVIVSGTKHPSGSGWANARNEQGAGADVLSASNAAPQIQFADLVLQSWF